MGAAIRRFEVKGGAYNSSGNMEWFLRDATTNTVDSGPYTNVGIAIEKCRQRNEEVESPGFLLRMRENDHA